jgi:hypothetical protein
MAIGYGSALKTLALVIAYLSTGLLVVLVRVGRPRE